MQYAWMNEVEFRWRAHKPHQSRGLGTSGPLSAGSNVARSRARYDAIMIMATEEI